MEVTPELAALGTPEIAANIATLSQPHLFCGLAWPSWNATEAGTGRSYAVR